MKKLLIILSFFSLAATCQDNQTGKSDNDAENPCDPDIMCTMEFRVINLEVVNQAGEPFIFEEYYSAIGSERLDIPKNTYQSKPGTYPVITDSQMDQLSFEGDTVSFVGVISENEVWTHQMIVGKDCCHIQLLDGEQKVVLER